jgi:hypothetical protein
MPGAFASAANPTWKPKVLALPQGVWKEGIAQSEVSSDRMRVRGGDADIFSKDGRRTRVTLKARDIRLSSDGNAFLVDVFCEVYERNPDNTRLTWEGTVRCPIPVDHQKGTSYATDVEEYERTWDVKGKEHDSLPVPNTSGTCIDAGVYRIDGKGDDRTNAAVELSLRIPFTYFDTSP